MNRSRPSRRLTQSCDASQQAPLFIAQLVEHTPPCGAGPLVEVIVYIFLRSYQRKGRWAVIQ